MLTSYILDCIITLVSWKTDCQLKCRCGGTGRRTGLKILRDLNPVPVRFRPSAPIQVEKLGFFLLFNIIHRYLKVLPQARSVAFSFLSLFNVIKNY